MSNREHQVRECAYYFWQAEGRPEGRAQVHWQTAEIAITLLSYLNAGAIGNGAKPTNSSLHDAANESAVEADQD